MLIFHTLFSLHFQAFFWPSCLLLLMVCILWRFLWSLWVIPCPYFLLHHYWGLLHWPMSGEREGELFRATWQWLPWQHSYTGPLFSLGCWLIGQPFVRPLNLFCSPLFASLSILWVHGLNWVFILDDALPTPEKSILWSGDTNLGDLQRDRVFRYWNQFLESGITVLQY